MMSTWTLSWKCVHKIELIYFYFTSLGWKGVKGTLEARSYLRNNDAGLPFETLCASIYEGDYCARIWITVFIILDLYEDRTNRTRLKLRTRQRFKASLRQLRMLAYHAN